MSELFLNIITPCSRPWNLARISESINVPRERYRWIVVLDMEPRQIDLPANCEAHFHVDPSPIPGSGSRGNAQRNLALDLIGHGHVYLNDDDTTMHPHLWECIKDLGGHDFISFDQSWQDGNPRLDGSQIGLCKTDSHNFIASRDLIGATRFRRDVYESDGYLVEEIYPRANSPVYIPRSLSVFNSLDTVRQSTSPKIPHFHQGIGQDWFTYPGLYSWAAGHYPSGSRFVEVGSWRGRSAAYLAVEIINSGKSMTLDCVDTWNGSPECLEPGPFFEPLLFEEDGLYLDFLRNIRPVAHVVRPIRAGSHTACSLYEDGSLDFVFLDADHSYETTRRDIECWLPKVRPGGVLAGHDYGERIGLPSVAQAVRDTIGHAREYQDCWVHGVGFTPPLW